MAEVSGCVITINSNAFTWAAIKKKEKRCLL